MFDYITFVNFKYSYYYFALLTIYFLEFLGGFFINFVKSFCKCYMNVSWVTVYVYINKKSSCSQFILEINPNARESFLADDLESYRTGVVVNRKLGWK